ncbi:MAG: ferrous iron transporter B, partial [Vicinamibacterales bacterium]
MSAGTPGAAPADAVIDRAAALRGALSASFRDEAVRSIYDEAARVAHRAVSAGTRRTADIDQRIDRIVTSPVFGLPLMALMLAVVFWVTVAGANVPSALLADGLFWIEDRGAALFTAVGLPW